MHNDLNQNEETLLKKLNDNKIKARSELKMRIAMIFYRLRMISIRHGPRDLFV